ncbi:Predicted DNA-binding transcriptional regulator YafY, contains an HTH and WYL domains [Brevibacterium siliguriense]|uniref:Predicted DNA-binding transcriptional regulator YafY, contains an HTH and WYL domains n=1 Tax=Brevibacterium siliguriense TaxID=1136497 RepID=A0A1H1Q5Z2_9MICO|nr:WYL domain-containing protein [Brevibacterium siliguriense]SDS18826.1 Predicted DNA-binding transcriptional regulator YafY, contains an HTH and WYL domains [Brevibacterium siliguriense]
MSQTAARLLGLLSLLMVPRTWSGTELADRLEVSPRTVRNDIGTLREIGYSINGTRGTEGGYRLSANGAGIPPLMFDADEAVAVAVGLHSGLSCIIGGMEETSALALAKLETILPAAVRAQVQSLAHFTVPVVGNQPMPIVDPNLIVTLIDHCRRHERLRFCYLDAGESATQEAANSSSAHGVHLEVEAYRLVNRQHRWQLLAFDPRAEDWRIFSAERIVPKTPSGRSFTPRPLPAEDIGDFVERHSTEPRWRHSAQVVVDAPASTVIRRLASAEGTVEALEDDRCLVTVGGQSLTTMALALARLDADFTVIDSPDLRDCLRRLSHLLGRAADDHAAPALEAPRTTNAAPRTDK